MTVLKSLILFLTLSVSTVQAFGQPLALFDTKLYAEKVTLCDLLNTFVNNRQDFTFVSFGSAFYSVSHYGNISAIFGSWTYTLRNDSLNQLSFTSSEFPITAEWFVKLSKLADSAINVFTAKYGKPDRDTVVKKNYFQKGKQNSSGDIRKAFWIIDGQKLKVDFLIDGEHGQFSYLLMIHRFKDYHGNLKLPPWWDGY